MEAVEEQTSESWSYADVKTEKKKKKNTSTPPADSESAHFFLHPIVASSSALSHAEASTYVQFTKNTSRQEQLLAPVTCMSQDPSISRRSNSWIVEKLMLTHFVV